MCGINSDQMVEKNLLKGPICLHASLEDKKKPKNDTGTNYTAYHDVV